MKDVEAAEEPAPTNPEEIYSQPPKVIYTSRDFTSLGLSTTQKCVLLVFCTMVIYAVKLFAVDKYFESEQVLEFLQSVSSKPAHPASTSKSLFDGTS